MKDARKKLSCFWWNWYWWRTKGCYHFKTCIQCLTPFYRDGGVCPACEEEWRQKERQRQKAYWQGRAYPIASTPWL